MHDYRRKCYERARGAKFSVLLPIWEVESCFHGGNTGVASKIINCADRFWTNSKASVSAHSAGYHTVEAYSSFRRVCRLLAKDIGW